MNLTTDVRILLSLRHRYEDFCRLLVEFKDRRWIFFFDLFTYRFFGVIGRLYLERPIVLRSLDMFDRFIHAFIHLMPNAILCLFLGGTGCSSSCPVFVSEIREELPVEFFPRSLSWSLTFQRWLIIIIIIIITAVLWQCNNYNNNNFHNH